MWEGLKWERELGKQYICILVSKIKIFKNNMDFIPFIFCFVGDTNFLMLYLSDGYKMEHLCCSIQVPVNIIEERLEGLWEPKTEDGCSLAPFPGFTTITEIINAQQLCMCMGPESNKRMEK